MRSRRVLVGLALVSCSKAEPPPPRPELAPQLSVRFGDCAQVDINWISGPAPTPFTDERAGKRGRAVIEPYTPSPIEHTRWEGLVPQILVPRAASSNTESEMPAGDDAAKRRGPFPHLFDPERPRGPTREYQPSHGNPLVAQAPAITRCLAASRKPYGVAVIQLGARRAVDGVDATTAACIINATRSIAVEQRCSLAFGTMPIGDLPTIDVTPTPSTMDLAARQGRLLGSSPPVVEIYGLNVIRAKDDVPIQHVAREISRVLMANEDFLLARATKGGWELFDPPSEPLPVVPVPHGTGAFWNRVPSPGQPGVDCDCVYFSLLSTKASVWVNYSRINEHVEVPRDAKFATALAAELAKMKHTPMFEDRTDVEIAATDDSTYGQLLDLVVIARTAGWTDWTLRSANTLHARPDIP